MSRSGRGWKTIRVFISSTFNDMNAERDHLVRFVFPKLRQDLLKWRVHLVDVDLRWGITEEEETIGVCNEIIDECRPRMICILGNNYGSIVPGTNKSYTEMEIEHFLCGPLSDEMRKDYCFFYYRYHNTLKDFYLQNRDIESNKELMRLKQFIWEEGFKPRIYYAESDADLVFFTDLGEFGSFVYSDIIWSVLDELGADIPVPLEEPEQEKAAMEAFAEDRANHFILGSRDSLMKDLIEFAQSDQPPNIFVLLGEPGSGKSALLSKFFLDYNIAHNNEIVIGHFIGASVHSAELLNVIRRFCQELSSEKYDYYNIDMLVSRFAELANEVTETSKIVIIIDALNRMTENQNFNPLEMGWLPARLPPGLKIVVSFTDENAAEHLRRSRGADIHKIKPLTPVDQKAILDSFLNRYKKKMTDIEKEQLLKKDDSKNPLYLIVALEELRTMCTREEMRTNLKDFGSNVHLLFRWILRDRLSRDKTLRDGNGQLIGETLVKEFMSYLVSSRHGLTQQEITDLVDPGDKNGNIAALQNLLKPYLMYRGECIDFYHDQFREAARDLYILKKSKEEIEYHRKLASYFKSLPANQIDRLSEEYPYQLMLCGDKPALAGVLSNLGLFEYSFKHGRGQEWMSYWRSLGQEFDANTWYRIAFIEEEKRGTILENGWIYQVVGWFLLEMAIRDHCSSESFEAAMTMFLKSLSIHQMNEKHDHASLAEALNGIAIICSAIGDNERAMQLWKKVLELRVMGLGRTHPKVAMILNNIGFGYSRMGNWKMAFYKYQEALKIYGLKEGVVYAASADVYNNIGLICMQRKKPEEALRNYENALMIMDKFIGSFNPNKATVLKNMSKAYEILGDHKRARESLLRASEILRRSSIQLQ